VDILVSALCENVYKSITNLALLIMKGVRQQMATYELYSFEAKMVVEALLLKKKEMERELREAEIVYVNSMEEEDEATYMEIHEKYMDLCQLIGRLRRYERVEP
jgi:hypothetical protein